MKRHIVYYALLALLVVATPAIAQQVPPLIVTVGSVPTVVGVIWDDPNPPSAGILNYQVLLDNAPAGDRVTEKTASVTVPTLGPHMITIQGFTATQATLPSGPFEFQLVMMIVLQAPENIRVTSLVAATEIKSGTDITVGGHRWTFESTHTLRDGVWVGGGLGQQYLSVPSGLYVLGMDSAWYRWDDVGAKWVLVGVKPTA